MKLIWSITFKILTFILLAVCATKVIFDCGIWAIPVGVVMILSFPLSAILHEVGHMLFGAVSGIKAVPDSKNIFTFLWESLINWWGESSCKIIPKAQNSIKARVIVTAAGGVAVNLVFVILGIIALCVPSVPVWLCALMPASFHLIAMNAMPFYFENGKTDGLVIYDLVRNSDEGQVMLAVLTVQAQVLGGKPIQDVDEKLLFDLPVIREDDKSFISLVQLRGEYFAAKGDEKNAAKWQQRLKELQEYI